MIYNVHCLGVKVQFTSNKGMSNDAPIHECESEIDQYTGHYMPYKFQTLQTFQQEPFSCSIQERLSTDLFDCTMHQCEGYFTYSIIKPFTIKTPVMKQLL